MGELYIHVSFMITGLILMTGGVVVARFYRTWRRWLKLHRGFGAAGAVSIVAGFMAAVYMVSLSGGPHISVLHARIGALTVLMGVFTPLLGQLQFLIPSRAAHIRPRHRQAGFITLFLGLSAVIAGLALLGA